MTVKDFLMFSRLTRCWAYVSAKSETKHEPAWMISAFCRSVVSACNTLVQLPGHLARDVRAGILVYVTATLPAILGLSLLTIDASRLFSLHTSLQKATDAMAIAGAAELDGTPSAFARSNSAIEEVVKNADVFSDENGGGPTDVEWQDVTVRYFAELPAADVTPLAAADALDQTNTDDAVRARFVEVRVETRNMTSIFPASFLGAPDVQGARSVSVAGNTQVVCRLMPLFICNPYEPYNHTSTNIYDDHGLFDNMTDPLERRKLIELKAAPGGTADYFPGNFAFLQVPAGPGANRLAEALAAGTVDACYSQSGVETQTGHATGPVNAAINTRFGLYNNPHFGNKNSDSRFRPARNVRKGQKQGLADNERCKEWEPALATDSLPFPQDQCFHTRKLRQH